MTIVKYTRITSVTANAGPGETNLLSPGILNTDYMGTLVPIYPFIARTGQVIRISAWGTTTNTDSVNGTARLRLYYGNNAGVLIADSGPTRPVLEPVHTARPWWFFAEILVKQAGNAGNAWCDGLFQNVEDPDAYNKMCGRGSFNLDTTIDTNRLEMTVTVSDHGTFTLNQCQIELLNGPV